MTTDANGCTKDVTSAIRDAKADYVLALKGNRGSLHTDIVERFAHVESRGFKGIRTHRSTSQGHGRSEERVVRIMPLKTAPAGWRDLKSAVMIDRTRTIGDETSTERSYYITSLGNAPQTLARAIRAHWQIENQLHWQLDVVFREDSRKIRDERAAIETVAHAKLDAPALPSGRGTRG